MEPTSARTPQIDDLADQYLNEHVRLHNKPSTAAEIERIVAKRIKPKLGRLEITDISRADVKAVDIALTEPLIHPLRRNEPSIGPVLLEKRGGCAINVNVVWHGPCVPPLQLIRNNTLVAVA